MRVRFDPEAAEELAEAARYLADRSPDLAERFLSDVAGAKDLLLRFPHASPPLRGGLRRVLLKTLPYQLVYRVEGDEVRIYAVAHLKRKPGYWRRRVQR